MDSTTLPSIPILMQFGLLIWSIAWKGTALWHAAKNNQKNWFIALFILSFPFINTVGILEIIYLFRFAKKRMTLSDLQFWKPKP